jgi:hypothetical protein
MESKLKEPKAPRTTLRGTTSSRNQHTNTTHTTQRSITVRSVRSRQHRPPGSLGEQQRTGTVHITLTLHKSDTQFPVGTSKERSSGASGDRGVALAKSSHPLSCEPSVPVTQNARRQTNPREDMFPQHLTELFSVHVLVARHNDNPFAEPTNNVKHRIVLVLAFWETTAPVKCNTLKRPASYRQWVQCNRKGRCRLVCCADKHRGQQYHALGVDNLSRSSDILSVLVPHGLPDTRR